MGLVLNLMGEFLIILDVVHQGNPLITTGVSKSQHGTVHAQLGIDVRWKLV